MTGAEIRRRLAALVARSPARIRDAGRAVVDADALTRKLAQWARCVGSGCLVVDVEAQQAVYVTAAPRELGHDVLVLQMPAGAKRDSWGDLLARCDAVVAAELERFADRAALRRALGLE